jgi:hypothetical protein
MLVTEETPKGNQEQGSSVQTKHLVSLQNVCEICEERETRERKSHHLSGHGVQVIL